MNTEGILASIPEDGWYVVLDGEQIGPISRDALWAHVEKGAADSSTYIWRQGFDEWKKIADAEGWQRLALLAAAAAASPGEDRTTVVPMQAQMQAVASVSEDDWDATLVEQERPESIGSLLATEPDLGADIKPARAAAVSPSELDRTMLVPQGEAAAASAHAAATAGEVSAASDLDSLFGDDDSGEDAADEGGGFFDVADRSAEPALSHQRRETSVLFSLDDVSAPSGGAKPKSAFAEPKTESGLIDIRAVAKKESRAQASKQTAGDLFADFSGNESSVAASLDTRLDAAAAPLIARKRERSGGGVWVFLVALLLLGGGGAAGYFLWWQPQQEEKARLAAAAQEAKEREAAAQAAAAEAKLREEAALAEARAKAEAEAARREAEAAIAKARAEADASAKALAEAQAAAKATEAKVEAREAADEAERVDLAAAKAAAPTDTGSAKATRPEPKPRKTEAPKAKIQGDKGGEVKAAAPTPPPAPKEEAPKASKGPSNEATALLNLVGSGGGGKAGGEAPKASAKPVDDSLPAQLSANQVRKAVRSHHTAIVSCHQATGDGAVTVNARLILAGSGQVTSASVVGPLAGTSTASCIEGKLRTVTFPAFGSPTQTVNIPLRLQ